MIFEKRKKGTKRELLFLGKKFFSYSKFDKDKWCEKILKLEQELEYIKNWQTDFFKDIPEKFPLIMSEKERNLLIKHIKLSQKHIEFGAGGSSFLALLYSDAVVYSVESNKNWIDYIQSWKFIRDKERENKISFNVIDIGQTGDWGYPVNNSNETDYPKYSLSIFEKLKDTHVDTIFIDGRFRVACALASILYCPYAKILMHDYTIRKEYHVIEEFLDICEVADTLTVFSLKKNFNQLRVKELYEKYKYVTQ